MRVCVALKVIGLRRDRFMWIVIKKKLIFIFATYRKQQRKHWATALKTLAGERSSKKSDSWLQASLFRNWIQWPPMKDHRHRSNANSFYNDLPMYIVCRGWPAIDFTTRKFLFLLSVQRSLSFSFTDFHLDFFPIRESLAYRSTTSVRKTTSSSSEMSKFRGITWRQ